ncbi:MAG: bifunctional serine/threonine-protein kinase/ABC transporter substrate-binding protein [Pseudonocardiaceae bacterium]
MDGAHRRLSDWLRGALRRDKPTIPGFRLGRRLSSPEQSTRVYRARQTEGPDAGNLVALKIIPNASPAQRAGLRREHQIAQAVVSQHVVKTYAVGAEATPPWLAAELIPGRDLRKVAPVRRADRYLAAAQAIADGLVDLHRQDYAHCDIKPENLVAHRSSGLAFIDLSWVRRVGDPEVVVVTGTTGWMAPERHAGGLTVPEEQRADVFSAGLTLCFLRTGRHLVDDQPDTAQQMINNHLAWYPADLDVLPAAMRPVIARALDYDPGQRPTAEELRAEIRRAIATQAALRPVWWRTRSAKATGAIIAAVAVSAGIIVAIQPKDPRCPLGTYSADHGDTVLRIGGLITRTGPVSDRGESQSAALRLAVNDVRAAGTSPNYRVEDYQLGRDEKDEGDPATDTICGSVDALLRNQTDVIIGPALSANTLKVLRTVTAAGSLLVAVSTAPDLSAYPDEGRFLRTAASDELQARVLSRQILDDGGGSVVVLTRDDAYGKGFRNVITRSLTDSGVRVALTESYDPSAINYDDLVRRVARVRPGAVVLVGFEESAKILRTLIAQGVNPQNTRIYGTDGNMSASLPGQVDLNNPGVLARMRGTSLLPLNPDFRRRIEELLGGPVNELTYAAETYDAVIVAALAAAAAGTSNPDAIARQAAAVTRTGEKCTDYAACLALIRQGRDIDYDGISGPLDFTETGEPCRAFYPILQFDAQGGMERLRTAEAVNLCVTMH